MPAVQVLFPRPISERFEVGLQALPATVRVERSRTEDGRYERVTAHGGDDIARVFLDAIASSNPGLHVHPLTPTDGGQWVDNPLQITDCRGGCEQDG